MILPTDWRLNSSNVTIVEKLLTSLYNAKIFRIYRRRQDVIWWVALSLDRFAQSLLRTSLKPAWPLSPDLFLSLSLFSNPHQSKVPLSQPCVGIITVHVVMTWISSDWSIQMMQRIRMRLKHTTESPPNVHRHAGQSSSIPVREPHQLLLQASKLELLSLSA